MSHDERATRLVIAARDHDCLTELRASQVIHMNHSAAQADTDADSDAA
jgi:hypothetical protein